MSVLLDVSWSGTCRDSLCLLSRLCMLGSQHSVYAYLLRQRAACVHRSKLHSHGCRRPFHCLHTGTGAVGVDDRAEGGVRFREGKSRWCVQLWHERHGRDAWPAGQAQHPTRLQPGAAICSLEPLLPCCSLRPWRIHLHEPRQRTATVLVWAVWIQAMRLSITIRFPACCCLPWFIFLSFCPAATSVSIYITRYCKPWKAGLGQTLADCTNSQFRHNFQHSFLHS